MKKGANQNQEKMRKCRSRYNGLVEKDLIGNIINGNYMEKDIYNIKMAMSVKSTTTAAVILHPILFFVCILLIV